jgi:hypothetical protein
MSSAYVTSGQVTIVTSAADGTSRLLTMLQLLECSLKTWDAQCMLLAFAVFQCRCNSLH